MTLASEPLETIAQRKAALRGVLGSLALENQTLDPAFLRIFNRWVRGSITLEHLGSLFDDVIYDHNPEARIDRIDPSVPRSCNRRNV